MTSSLPPAGGLYWQVAVAFVFGAIIGSFLNVCIYRIPRRISFISPMRSFCPACGTQIPWHLNVPILSWLVLRGRCAHCHAQIDQRYLIVELLTAGLFAVAAWIVPVPTLFSIWVILAILVVTTFVDLEFFIIPDLMSKSGIVAGLVLSVLTPALHQTSAPLQALLSAIAGGLTGALILFLVGEFGKLAFGRYKVTLSTPAQFYVENLPEAERQIVIDRESFLWSEHFFRRSDRIVLRATEVEIDEIAYRHVELTFFEDRLCIAGKTIQLDKIKSLSGWTTGGQFPREAMGVGDMKLITAIGTFVGWQGVLFTIAAGSFIGAASGLLGIILGRWARSQKIPFGPFLAIAGTIWLFWGQELGRLYARVLGLA
jgi:leader peptidase (prepilin peptidase) / N-methyltransferase